MFGATSLRKSWFSSSQERYSHITRSTLFSDDEVESDPFGPFSWCVTSYSNSKDEGLCKTRWKPHRPNLLDSFEEEVDALNNDKNN